MKMMKRLKMIIAVCTMMMPLALIPSSGAGAVSTASWFNCVAGTFNKMTTTYNQIESALNGTGSDARIEQLFTTYSDESVLFAECDTSSNGKYNANVRALAQVSNTWAWVGYETISAGATNLGPWKIVNAQLLSSLVKFTKDLK